MLPSFGAKRLGRKLEWPRLGVSSFFEPFWCKTERNSQCQNWVFRIFSTAVAQRCLCNRSSGNLTFLPNICQPQAMYPNPGRDIWWKVAVLHYIYIYEYIYIYIHMYVTGSHQPFSLVTWWIEDLSLSALRLFSLVFMLSTIYLRLEGKIPPPPPPGLRYWSHYR